VGDWIWLGYVLVAWTAVTLAPIWLGLLRPRRLADVPPLPEGTRDAPAVSIIIPARDEEREIESALTSMLRLDYPNLELIAVNDRSTDATGRIMDQVAAADSRCRVIHVTDLPPGWLGKNHANWLGARMARGEYLLFTDGDVKFAPTLLSRAMAHMRARRLDHLTLIPDPGRGSFWEGVLMSWFMLCFSLYTHASLARFRWARWAAVGIGAFNLVRREAYEAIGTHERLRMEVTDDVMLGRLIKRQGLAQDVLLGRPLLHVRWQDGAWGIVRGLEKNAFAGARFSVPKVVAAVLASIMVAALPVGLLLPWPWWMVIGVVLMMLVATYLWIGVEAGYSPLIAIFYPVGTLLFGYVLARSAFVALRDGGITWRGTFYPLAELKAGMV